jgi:purine-binding chemotaxis protein CheW
MSASTSTTIEKNETANRGGKYLTFALGQEEYGLAILKVREIIGFMDITVVPHTPPYVRGVINLRGQIISVVDLRTRFGLPAAVRTDHTCIIVVEINIDSRRISLGIVVDRVSEVLNIPPGQIEDTPGFGRNIDTSFILGMGKVGGSVRILLDIDKVLTAKQAAAAGIQSQ